MKTKIFTTVMFLVANLFGESEWSGQELFLLSGRAREGAERVLSAFSANWHGTMPVHNYDTYFDLKGSNICYRCCIRKNFGLYSARENYESFVLSYTFEKSRLSIFSQVNTNSNDSVVLRFETRGVNGLNLVSAVCFDGKNKNVRYYIINGDGSIREDRAPSWIRALASPIPRTTGKRIKIGDVEWIGLDDELSEVQFQGDVVFSGKGILMGAEYPHLYAYKRVEEQGRCDFEWLLIDISKGEFAVLNDRQFSSAVTNYEKAKDSCKSLAAYTVIKGGKERLRKLSMAARQPETGTTRH